MAPTPTQPPIRMSKREDSCATAAPRARRRCTAPPPDKLLRLAKGRSSLSRSAKVTLDWLSRGPVESIYFVMSWVCHRTCEHCYEDRFHPYHGEELQRLVRQSQENVPRIIDNLPGRMTYLDLADPDENGNFREKRGRIIVAGGEILLDAVRESVLYPALEQLRRKYGNGVELIVQTTGDILTEKHIIEMLDRGVSVISVSGMDAYHEG